MDTLAALWDTLYRHFKVNITVDLYTDYLISSTAQTTATGMASLLSIAHDQITSRLSSGQYDSKFLWKYAKPYVQELYSARDKK